MSKTNNYPDFVKASWLADIGLNEFFIFTQAEIDYAMKLYTELDREFYKFEPKCHNTPRLLFHTVSDMYDKRRKKNA